MSRASILATAYRDGTRPGSRGPGELAAWISGFGSGVDLYADAVFPNDLCFDDVDLLSWALDGEPPWLAVDEISLGHVLAAAGITGRSPREIVGRLLHLGFTVPRLPDGIPDTVDSVDVVLLSGLLDGKAPRLTNRRVPLAHVYHAACILSCDVAEVRERYEQLGLEVLGEPVELGRLDRGHVTVVFHATETADPDSDRISSAQILAVAQFTGRDPQRIRESFLGLGLAVPPEAVLPDIAARALTARDAIMLSCRLDGRGPWLGEAPVPHAHVIAAAGYIRCSPRQVINRLTQLGCAVPGPTASVQDIFVDGVDRQFAELLTDTSGAYVRRAVSRAEVLAASFRFRWTPARIAERMMELGFRVPSATSLISETGAGTR